MPDLWLSLDLRTEESEVLTFAAASSLRKAGNLAAATVVHQSIVSPSTAAVLLNASKTDHPQKSQKMSPAEALAISLDCGLSKNNYIRLRINSKKFRKSFILSLNLYLTTIKVCHLMRENKCFSFSLFVQELLFILVIRI